MDALYQKALLALAQQTRQSASIDDPSHIAGENNPVCGDRVDLSITLDNTRITAAAAEVKGCALCEAGAGLWLEIAPHHTLDEMPILHDKLEAWLKDGDAELPFLQAEPLAPIRNIKNRHKCVLLALKAATHFTPV